MSRAFLMRTVAGTVAALALVTAVPSLATAQHRSAPGEVTLDFTAHLPQSTTGKDFGGLAEAKDGAGNHIGGAVVNCEDVPGALGDVFYCTGAISLDNRGDIAFQAGSLTSRTSGPEHEADGIITGGTNEFEGIAGELKVTRQSRAVYTVSFNTNMG
ncbi:hypothetical protein ABT095_29325 [Kitasatospora sp. NPDC002227]|uniref:hypothetical protein n=1 Tax=Kitasatospora sp. NPDC002227 TaxID=3154773 RepID=UPI0033286AA0